jgi:hypothetical protein
VVDGRDPELPARHVQDVHGTCSLVVGCDRRTIVTFFLRRVEEFFYDM